MTSECAISVANASFYAEALAADGVSPSSGYICIYVYIYMYIYIYIGLTSKCAISVADASFYAEALAADGETAVYI